jgi:chemotaxis protein methyltransferase CheR
MDQPPPFGAAPGTAGDPVPPSRARVEFHLGEDDLRRISERGRATLGLELGEGKRQMVYSRLSRRLRALGLTSFSDYLDLLDSPAGAAEAVNFANALTTNLTAFFREAHHFDHFEREIRRRPADPTRRLRIWSAGCSTGEEAYSIAMILHANADVLAGRDRRILATDVDTDVLDTAARATFPSDRLRAVPPRFRSPVFLEGSPRELRMVEAVRSLVVFRMLNLIGPWPFRGAFDAIFCRNVLIYFSPALRDRLIDRFADIIQPGGLLYLGHSESVLGSHPKFVSEGHTIYRRVSK